MTPPQNPHGWRKSDRSANTSTRVEVGRICDGAAVRDTKDRAAGYLTTTERQWRTSVPALEADRFD
ncbi:hypothetical protein FHR84_002385 [Actinopolyspora biskrensis]|uniref:DUF397 domain-containing protein n=1 Tax=Actinopolyspora biskrensis TaxID=1470178 RepID=A0A852YWP1_9ACTN|nr:hypothetical protein [Actinopolyspora biskrensis]